MTAGAAQALWKQQRILAGRRILLAGTGPLQIVLAADLVSAGAEVVAVLEGARSVARAVRHAGALWGQGERVREGLSSGRILARAGVPVRFGWGLVAAHGTAQLESVTVARLDARWHHLPGTEETVACDTLCVGYGFIPSNALSRLLGATQDWRPDLGGEVPRRDAHLQTSVPGVYAVGDGAGVGGGPLAMLEGEIAGAAAAAETRRDADPVARTLRRLAPALARERRFQRLYAALFTPGPGLYAWSRDETILCRCEEVTRADVRRAVSLGADSADDVKAVVRCGMGDCQGRMCGQLVAQCIAGETGRAVPDIGMFRPRPPIVPVPVPALGRPADEGAGSGEPERARP
jgi:bacterioferritin-associated ferredoxin